jgi:hypothetical protein
VFSFFSNTVRKNEKMNEVDELSCSPVVGFVGREVGEAGENRARERLRQERVGWTGQKEETGVADEYRPNINSTNHRLTLR